MYITQKNMSRRTVLRGMGVSLALPFAPDEPIDITVYDIRGDLLEEGLSVPYKAPLKRDLDKYSLLVVEPAR